PCMDAIDSAVVHVSANLAQDPRWPRWGPQAVQRWGIHSALAVPLVAQTRPYGSLNLFGDRADAYAEDAQAVAQALATQLALAMANAREIEQRGDAMANRTVIGQAEGMLMERLHLSSAQAFAYLRRVSQATNQKLVTVAADIVHTRRLPDADGSTGHRGDRAPR
ncbi:MAG: GAF and ANTAR domain-containing protein, partial [Actinomycetes bacterium]